MPEQRPLTKQDLHEALGALEERLTERMRDMQTEVLRAFHDCRIERGELPPHPRS